MVASVWWVTLALAAEKFSMSTRERALSLQQDPHVTPIAGIWKPHHVIGLQEH
jgi:hypothetical protein